MSFKEIVHRQNRQRTIDDWQPTTLKAHCEYFVYSGELKIKTNYLFPTEADDFWEHCNKEELAYNEHYLIL